MSEIKRLCRNCRWFNPSPYWDPREGQCMTVKDDGEMRSKEKVTRISAKLVGRDQDAGNCPNYELLDKSKQEEFMKRINW